MFPATSPTPHHAFTLIELLVSIAIISLLASILFPVFSQARENARRASCQSNLRQIGMGFSQYVQDFDGMMPGTQVNSVAWPVLLIPYTKSGQLFTCPSPSVGQQFNVDTDLVYGSTSPSPAPYSSYYGATDAGLSGSAGTNVKVISYGRNCIPRGGTGGNVRWSSANFNANGRSGFVGFVSGNTTTTTAPLLEAAIQDPSGTIHIVDAMSSSNDGDSIGAITYEKRTDRYSDAEASKVSYRHFYGFNALFGDGHVKWRRYNSTTANEWTIQDDKPDGSLN